jgi:MFS family permease
LDRDLALQAETPHAARRARGPVLALLSANTVSQIGNGAAAIAIPWFVLETSGSAARAGIVGAAGFVPMIAAGVFGGALIDRLGYKRTSVIADIASAGSVVMIPLLHVTTGLAFWQLVVLVFLGALLDSPGVTARTSLLPDLAESANMPLERINGLTQSAAALAMLLSPPIAGAMIAGLSARDVLWMDAVTFLVSAAAVTLFVPEARRSGVAEVARGLGTRLSAYWSDLREGFAFVKRDRLVFNTVINNGITNLVAAPLGAVLMPVYGREAFGSAAKLGALLTGFGVGALVGALGFGALGPRLPRRATLATSFLLLGTPFVLLTLRPPLYAALAIFVFTGLMYGPAQPVVSTVMHERVPADMRGRAFGMLAAISLAAAPLGMLLMGLIVEYAGLNAGFFASATIFCGTALNLAINPVFRKMNRPSADAPSDSAAR